MLVFVMEFHPNGIGTVAGIPSCEQQLYEKHPTRVHSIPISYLLLAKQAAS